MKNQNKTILLIEDNTDIAEAVQMLLEDEGFTVIVAENEEYLLHFKNNPLPDIILLDMLLSGIDGRDIITSLKSKKETKSIPTILMSAHPNAKNIWKESGANDFIAKPFDIDSLVS